MDRVGLVAVIFAESAFSLLFARYKTYVSNLYSFQQLCQSHIMELEFRNSLGAFRNVTLACEVRPTFLQKHTHALRISMGSWRIA